MAKDKLAEMLMQNASKILEKEVKLDAELPEVEGDEVDEGMVQDATKKGTLDATAAAVFSGKTKTSWSEAPISAKGTASREKKQPGLVKEHSSIARKKLGHLILDKVLNESFAEKTTDKLTVTRFPRSLATSKE